MSGKAEKVYIITTNFDDMSWPEAVKKTFDLDREIQILAKKSGSAVHLHQYKEPVMGAPGTPVVLLECSDDFLEKVKGLPLFDAVRDLPSGVQTIRRSDAPQIEPPEAQKPPKNKGPNL